MPLLRMGRRLTCSWEDGSVARQDETSKPVPAARLGEGHQPLAPFWMRIPRGWIILGLFLLAWLGVYLIWNGLRLLAYL